MMAGIAFLHTVCCLCLCMGYLSACVRRAGWGRAPQSLEGAIHDHGRHPNPNLC